MKINILIIAVLFLAIDMVYSQDYGTGLLMEDQYFENNAKSVTLTRGDYQNLPESNSIKEFSPTPGSQGAYGTCTGWSSAYAGRTILEAMRNNWSRDQIDENTFSPSYIYNQIKKSKDCYGGASIIDALDILKNQGGVKLSDFAYDCELTVSDDHKDIAKNHTIVEYREVSDRFTKNKVERVKKSLSEYKPVVIALNCPNSFFSAGDLWEPSKSDFKQWPVGHAMCLVGYDDNKYGGAFEIMNSWSTQWGNGGYTWIKYDDFQYFCLFAFELIDRAISEKDQWDLSGSLKFVESSGEPMRTVIEENFIGFEIPYVSGTLFELFVSNDQPAYVYAFGTDLSNVTYKIFPFHDQMSPYLPYAENNFAVPSEGSYTMLDENDGTTYYVFLYSNKELDIDSILVKFEENESDFLENLDYAIGDEIIDRENIEYTDGEILSFRAKSDNKSILPVVVRIAHD